MIGGDLKQSRGCRRPRVCGSAEASRGAIGGDLSLQTFCTTEVVGNQTAQVVKPIQIEDSREEFVSENN